MARRRQRTVLAALNARHSLFTPRPQLPPSLSLTPTPPTTFTLIPITLATLPDQVDREPGGRPHHADRQWTWKAVQSQNISPGSSKQYTLWGPAVILEM